MTHEVGEHHWGATAIDVRGANLPALKAAFLVNHAPTDGTVCEIGCGDGKMLRTLAAARPRLVLHGCDVQDPSTPPDGFAFHRIVDALPFGDRSLDAVLLFDVLEHVPTPEKTLAEAARVLKPGGRLIAFVPVEGEKFSFYELYRQALGRDIFAVTKEHIQAFSHAELRRLIETRFDVTELRYAYHWLGQAMDASFFAAARLPQVRSFWWKDNVYYNAKPSRQSLPARAANVLLQVGNAAAWAESTLLSRVRLGSAGVLASAQLRAP